MRPFWAVRIARIRVKKPCTAVSNLALPPGMQRGMGVTIADVWFG